MNKSEAMVLLVAYLQQCKDLASAQPEKFTPGALTSFGVEYTEDGQQCSLYAAIHVVPGARAEAHPAFAWLKGGG